MSSLPLLLYTLVNGCGHVHHMISHDIDMYGNDDGSIPATFEIMNLIGWKPHASQVCFTEDYRIRTNR